MQDDIRNISYLCLSLFNPGPNNGHPPANHPFKVLHDGRVPEHGIMHRRDENNRHAAPDGSGGKGGDRSVINATSDLGDGIGGSRSDQQKVCCMIIPTVGDMLDKTGDPGDRLPATRIGQGIRMDEMCGSITHYRLDTGSPSLQFVGKLYRLHGRNAAGDSQYDQFPVEILHSITTSATRCQVPGPVFFTRCTSIPA